MCSQNTGKIAKGHAVLFLSQLQKIGDLVSEEITCDQNLIGEMTGIIKEFKEIDGNTKN